MPEYSGFFNSIGQDRLYGADELSRFYNAFATNGILTTGSSAYNYTAGSGLSFTIGSGKAMVDGYFHANEGNASFFLSPASGGNNRIDFLALRLEKSSGTRRVSLVIIQGTAQPSPNPPLLADTGLVVDIPLYRFYVPSGASSMGAVTVTDRRLYSLETQARNFLNPEIPFTNLNSVYDNGNYYISVPASYSNNPTDQQSLLEVFKAPDGKTFQRVTEINTGSTARNAIFQRASTTAGAWQSWTATYSDKQNTFSLAFTGGVSGSGSNFYAIIGDRVRIEAIAVFPTGLASGATIATITASARPSTLTYLPPIFGNNGQRISIAIQPSGEIQNLTAITSNTSVSIFADFLLRPIR